MLSEFPNTITGEIAITSARHAAVQGADRIQGWLRRSDYRKQLKREMELRLEERCKEREPIARELHDTLFQGCFSARSSCSTKQ
jgi:signal transduction histidine kinase